MNKKLLIIGLIIIAVLTVAVFLIPKPQTETAGWKTYTNAKFGYQVQYPQNLTIRDLDTNSKFITVGFNPPSEWLDINVIAADDLASGGFGGCPQPDYSSTPVTINRLQFYRSDISNDYRGMHSLDETAIEYCTLGKDGNMYSLVVRGPGTTNDAIPKIINSFKFTK